MKPLAGHENSENTRTNVAGQPDISDAPRLRRPDIVSGRTKEAGRGVPRTCPGAVAQSQHDNLQRSRMQLEGQA